MGRTAASPPAAKLYTPEPWVKDLTTYPGFTTAVPEGGLSARGPSRAASRRGQGGVVA